MDTARDNTMNNASDNASDNARARQRVSQSKRIVIKIGTNILMGTPTGENPTTNQRPNIYILESLIKQIVLLQKMGKEIVLVSSGAIGCGAAELNETYPIIDIPLRQACASVGQAILMNIYKKAFLSYGYHCAQILLTGNDFQTHASYQALKNCIETLFSKHTIPIVNENDSVSIDEIGIAFGDNDNLSAVLANKINADMLVICTDIDGVYDKNPRHYNDAKKIPLIDKNTISTLLKEKKHFESTGSNVGTGGMKTKLQAAYKIIEGNGITTIVLGTEKEVLINLMKGLEIGTVICDT